MNFIVKKATFRQAVLILNRQGFIGCQKAKFNLSPDPIPPKKEECEGDPCDPTTGNESQLETDIPGLGVGGLRFERFYNSLGDHNSSESLAPGWRHTYDRHLNESALGSTRLNPALSDQSSLYDTPTDACLSGWKEIKNSVWNGALAGATATLTGAQDCQINLPGKTVASFSIRPNIDLFAPLPLPSASSSLITLSRPDGRVYHFKNNNGVWSDPFHRMLPSSKVVASGYLPTLITQRNATIP